ncbi:DUF645 family protein [Vibrio cholerae]|nr:DUF645 family protein [Vibrio cholerae]EJL6442086.1 DUF645 family protein [Vibrio cholerae]
MLDAQHGQLSFTKCCIIAVILLYLSRTLNRDQLNHDSFEFWLFASPLLVLVVCLLDTFA